METDRPAQVTGAFARFVAGERRPPRPGLQGLYARTAATAPAYAKFLREHGIDVAEAKTERDFRRLPMTGKDSLREQIRASLRSR